jgi:hypothetical protein
LFNDYTEAGFHRTDAQRWVAAGYSAADAAAFRSMGMSPRDARSWGLHPLLVQRFRALRFTKEEAWHWAMTPVWPDHAVHWRHAGYTPEEAKIVIILSRSPIAALAWTLTGLSPSEVLDRARLTNDRPASILADLHSTRSSTMEVDGGEWE